MTTPLSSTTHIKWPAQAQQKACRAVLKRAPEDFVVREELAFEPTGEGDHLYLWVEKRGVSAMDMVRRLAVALDVAADDIGTAGLKDTHAVTQQWVSVPRSEEVERRVRFEGTWDDALRVQKNCAHPHKLRTGLLRGNHFVVRLAELQGEDVRSTLTARWEQLKSFGLLNAFGSQRFGRNDNTLSLGLELLASPLRRVKRQLRRLALSAVQAALFNRWLHERVADGCVHEVLHGDVMQVVASGGPFWADDVAEVQTRLADKKVVISGPIFGPKMRRARDAAAAREERILTDAGLSIESFAQHGKLCLGTRRAAVVWPKLEALQFDDANAATLTFFLPAGSYATELVAALVDEVDTARQVPAA